MNPALRARIASIRSGAYEPIGMIGTVPLAIVAHPSAPADSWPS
jgi:hypothetical protein